MKVSKDTIEHVAKLACLNIPEEEIEKLTAEMESIISYMDKLNELDTTGIKPMEHVIPIRNVMRDDVVIESFKRDRLMKNAPLSANGCYKAPNIL